MQGSQRAEYEKRLIIAYPVLASTTPHTYVKIAINIQTYIYMCELLIRISDKLMS